MPHLMRNWLLKVIAIDLKVSFCKQGFRTRQHDYDTREGWFPSHQRTQKRKNKEGPLPSIWNVEESGFRGLSFSSVSACQASYNKLNSLGATTTHHILRPGKASFGSYMYTCTYLHLLLFALTRAYSDYPYGFERRSCFQPWSVSW